MRILRSSIVINLFCLSGVLLLSPIATAESESLNSARRPRVLKSEKSEKVEKLVPVETSVPTSPKDLKKHSKTGEKKEKKVKQDKTNKTNKKNKKIRNTEAPTIAPSSNAVDVVVPLCSAECFGDVAGAAAASEDLISELQISAAASFPFPVDPRLITVVDLASEDCIGPCGVDTSGGRNLQQSSFASLFSFRLDFSLILNGQSLESVLEVSFSIAFASNQAQISDAFSRAVGIQIVFDFENSSESYLFVGGATKAPGALLEGRTRRNRYLGYVY